MLDKPFHGVRPARGLLATLYCPFHILSLQTFYSSFFFENIYRYYLGNQCWRNWREVSLSGVAIGPSRVGESPTRGVKMRKKMSKIWGQIRKIDQNLRKKGGKWNSCPPGTVRLATALVSLVSAKALADPERGQVDELPARFQAGRCRQISGL